MICQVCENRQTQGFVCDRCLDRMRTWLDQIPGLYLELWRWHQLDLRYGVPSLDGPATVGGVRVSGSKERKLPIDTDTVDLLLQTSFGISGYCFEPDSSTPVLPMLDLWATVLRSRWFTDQHPPAREVRAIALWLTERLERVAEVDQDAPALSEALRRAVGQLLRVLEGVDPQPEDRHGRCEKCQERELEYWPDWEIVKCKACGHAMTDEQYAEYLRQTVKINRRNRTHQLGIHA